MNKDWNYGILDDAVVKGSSNISLNKIKEEVGDYPVFGAKGFMKNVSFYQQEKEYLGIIKDGAGIGRVSKHPAKSSILATMQYIIPKEDYEIDFVRYFLESLDFENYRTGSTIPHIYYKDYKTAKFPLVDISEQKQIVAILDKAFAAIDQAQANIEKNIANAKELFQSKLNAIFSHPSTGSGGKANTEPAEVWEEKMIIELCEHKSQIVGGPFGSNLKVKDYRERGVPILRLQNIGKGYFIDKDIKYITKEKAKELEYHSFKAGDIVLAKLGIPIGKTCIVPNKFSFGIVVADVVRIRPNKNEINYDFLKHFLNSDNSVNQLTADIRGATRPRVNIAEVRNLKLSVPSIEKQVEIATFIDGLESFRNELIAKYEDKFNFLEDLKKSLLQKAFAGALTSTRWISPTAKIIPLQPVTGISTTDLQAGITALALQKHIAENQQHTFHHVKAEKIIHLSEYILNIDLDRNPTKDAAGPNDFPHAKKVESRARKAGFYSVIKKEGYYEYVHRRRMDSIIEKMQNCLGEKVDILSQIIDTLIPMKTKQVEIVATLYAAWNNLLIRKEVINNEAIVYEARENWHKSKLNIERERFFKAIEWMKKHDFLIPKGNGKLIQAKSN